MQLLVQIYKNHLISCKRKILYYSKIILISSFSWLDLIYIFLNIFKNVTNLNISNIYIYNDYNFL